MIGRINAIVLVQASAKVTVASGSYPERRGRRQVGFERLLKWSRDVYVGGGEKEGVKKPTRTILIQRVGVGKTDQPAEIGGSGFWDASSGLTTAREWAFRRSFGRLDDSHGNAIAITRGSIKTSVAAAVVRQGPQGVLPHDPTRELERRDEFQTLAVRPVLIVLYTRIEANPKNDSRIGAAGPEVGLKVVNGQGSAHPPR